ncbi:12225_t:CDS:1, partial [Cetraspora pellucida]
RAIALLEEQKYVLIKFNDHNHAPEASCANMIQALNAIKEMAS